MVGNKRYISTKRKKQTNKPASPKHGTQNKYVNMQSSFILE